jgi:hypothetical protein
MGKRLTQEQAIQRCIDIHGDKYDYSMLIYIGITNKIEIICKEHGSFWQVIDIHLRGSGCHQCARISRSKKHRKTTKDFIQEAIKVHGNKYDYSKVDYIKNNDPVIIICKNHGEFLQLPIVHILMKSNCPKCSNENRGLSQRKTTKDFIQEAIKVHGNKYDYSKVDYQGAHTHITIICKKHGEFSKTPGNHIIDKQGCKYCSFNDLSIKRRKTTKDFIQKAIKVHGNKYDYSKVDYINSQTLISIICKNHGIFLQLPGNHIYQKTGCAKCAHINHPGKYSISSFQQFPDLININAIYYTVILIKSYEIFLKRGITITSVKSRFINIPYEYEIVEEEHLTLYEAFCKEQKELEKYKYLKYEPLIHFGGHTECFTLKLFDILFPEYRRVNENRITS